MYHTLSKKDLSTIAKRYCKSVLNNVQTPIAFLDSGLTDDDIEYIHNKILSIANNITDEPVVSITDNLLNEYKKK